MVGACCSCPPLGAPRGDWEPWRTLLRAAAANPLVHAKVSGLYPPDAGEVRLDGRPAPSLGDIAAWRGRIATVFQHSMVVPSLTVAENVFLGRPPSHGACGIGVVDWRRMREQTRQVMAEWGFDVNADTACGNLTVEQRQVVEITRALAAGTRCLLLDEPTTALEQSQIDDLLEIIKRVSRERNIGILLIDHKLDEVYAVADRIAQQLDAGADHIMLHVLGPDGQPGPVGAARRLAARLCG